MSGIEPPPPAALAGEIDTPDLRLSWLEAPWDSAIFGFPVLTVARIEVLGPEADRDLLLFVEARNRTGSQLVSCRLPHDRLRESMLLERHGFGFVEMVYHPELRELAAARLPCGAGLTVRPACESDLPAIVSAAGNAFRSDRFHMDPRIDSSLGDERYRGWVRSALSHSSQRLYAVLDADRLVAFFVTEMKPDGTCYWHLNAVVPEAQGQGYGKRAWVAMLEVARSAGAARVQTCITARNTPVLNLYSHLGFRFPEPLMTFHWAARR